MQDSGTSLGQQTLDATGAATLTLTNPTATQHKLAVNYMGDKVYAPATATAAVAFFTVDFSLAPTAPTQTIKTGGTAVYTIGLAPTGPFAGTVTLTCSGLPSGYACSSTPAFVAVQPVTATLTVAPTVIKQSRSLTVAGAGILLSLLFFRFRRGRIATPLLMTATCLLLTGLLNGCGGSSASTSSTPPSTTTFTITATGMQGTQTVTHTSTATLVLQ